MCNLYTIWLVILLVASSTAQAIGVPDSPYYLGSLGPFQLKALEGSYDTSNNVLRLWGDIKLTLPDSKTISSDKLLYDPVNQLLLLEGNVHGTIKGNDNQQILFSGPSLTMYLKQNKIYLPHVKFGLVKQKMIGSAQELIVHADSSMSMRNAIFTSCYCSLDAPMWSIHAKKTTYKQDKIIYEDVQLKIADFPILYMQNITYPLQSPRSKGFTQFTIYNTKNKGIMAIIPHYWPLRDGHSDTTLSTVISSKDKFTLIGQLRIYNQPNYFMQIESGITPFSKDKLIPFMRLQGVYKLNNSMLSYRLTDAKDIQFLKDYRLQKDAHRIQNFIKLAQTGPNHSTLMSILQVRKINALREYLIPVSYIFNHKSYVGAWSAEANLWMGSQDVLDGRIYKMDKRWSYIGGQIHGPLYKTKLGNGLMADWQAGIWSFMSSTTSSSSSSSTTYNSNNNNRNNIGSSSSNNRNNNNAMRLVPWSGVSLQKNISSKLGNIRLFSYAMLTKEQPVIFKNKSLQNSLSDFKYMRPPSPYRAAHSRVVYGATISKKWGSVTLSNLITNKNSTWNATLLGHQDNVISYRWSGYIEQRQLKQIEYDISLNIDGYKLSVTSRLRPYADQAHKSQSVISLKTKVLETILIESSIKYDSSNSDASDFLSGSSTSLSATYLNDCLQLKAKYHNLYSGGTSITIELGLRDLTSFSTGFQ